MKYKYPYFTLSYDVYTYTGAIYITRSDFDRGLEMYYTQYHKQQQCVYNEHIQAEPTGADASTSVGREGHQDKMDVRSPPPPLSSSAAGVADVYAGEVYVKHT